MKRKLILIFCLLLGLAWFSAVSEAMNNPKKVEAHLAKGEELESRGIYVDAIIEYEKALEYEPDNATILLKTANAYLQTGNSKKFVSICKNTAEQHPEDVSALTCLMNYYVEKNDEAAAVKYIDDFTKCYPEHTEAQKWLLQLKGTYIELFCNYDEFSEIYYDSMVVKKENVYGLADSLGDEVIKPGFQEIHPYSVDGLALAYKDGKYIYVDEDGQTRLVLDEIYAEPGMLSSKRTVASKDGKYGYLDQELQPVTEFVWDKLSLVSDQVGAGQMNDKWAIVNKNGKPKTEYIYEDVILDSHGFCSGQKRIFVKEPGGYHMINQKGETVGELWFDMARCFSNSGYAAVCKDEKWGFVDCDGELRIQLEYDDAKSFHNGFAAIFQNGKWGYIDELGNVVIEPVFEEVTAMSANGTAVVKQGEWKLIQLNLFR